ncbi:Signal transduction histidine-protein kinase BarA [Maioricimonas rarisocia]|uniref:Sensory/regulatory protein RpfC n=1 Tax=Maioricimonas rarisocia TaxID=2528026 RepID=A0A517ZEK4_9PLAN|nr:PAS domain S-box protein [Maioricimonas rarisocia]QDU40884.1 Signal transduction histidine-protein kinase BarA [Maioricimonas rarisocia]
MTGRQLTYWTALGITLSLGLPIAGSLITAQFFPHVRFAHLPIHSLLEAMGGLMAITIAGILVAERTRKEGHQHYAWMAGALVGMGVLDLYHAAVMPGARFVWLHSTATFVGGTLFALVWWPPERSSERFLRAFPWVTFLGTILFGGMSCMGGWLPAMVTPGGEFTLLAQGLNVGGGFAFLVAAVFFVRRYHLGGDHEDWLFAVHTSLFGAAGILFELSVLWDAAWWWWHILRLCAYLAALAFATRAYLAAEREVFELNRELARVNQNLDQTVADRTDELKSSEERYALAVRGSSDGLWDWNILTDEVYYAPRFKELLGYADEEFPNLFETFESHLHPDDRESTKAALREHLTDRVPYDVEYRLRTKSGEYRWFRARGQAVWDDRQGATRMAGSITDITERKQAEALLEHERFLLHTLLTYLPDAIYFKDAQGHFTRVSRTLAQLLGANDPDAVIGKTDADFFPGEFADRAHRDELAIMESGQPLIGKEEQPNWGGEEAWVLTTKVPLRDRRGQIVGTFGISHDITALKQAEARFRRVVEAAPNPMLVVGADGRIQLINNATETLFGYERADLIGKPIERLVPEKLRGRHEEYRNEYFQNPSARAMGAGRELLGRRSDGSVFPVEVGLSPMTLDGKMVVLSSIYDVTTRKQAEAALVEAKEAAEDANRAKSDFLANMSHEIRTPMNAIIGMSELLLDDQLTPGQRNYAQTVLEAAESLLSIINEILDFSKIEAGHLELESIDFDLREEIVDMLRTLATRAHRKKVELIWQVDSDVPARVIGDPVRLRQVLLNLVGNAIKFTEQGEIAVTVTSQSQTDSNVRLHFSVRDTGIGIPPTKLKRIFSAFTQADTSTTRQYGGTGLGLTISSRLVEAMGGEIQVESEAGKGSTFHFTAELGWTEIPTPPEALQDWPDLHDEPVLVIDDNATNRHILREMLESWGMQVETVEGGPEAIERINDFVRHQARLPLLLSDVHMPDMDGFMLVERLRRSAETRDAVVILLTSGGRPGDAERRRKLEISAHIMKPVKQSELLDAIMFAVGKPRVSATEATSNEEEPEKLPPLNILLAEDGKANQRLAVALLQRWGHTVTVAANGRLAVEAWKDGDFDLILMDVQMPELDGLAATQIIRQREADKGGHIPIVAMTARAMKGDRERCLEAGMDDYVSKPVRKHELYEAIAPLFTTAESTPGETQPEAGTTAGSNGLVDWPLINETVDGCEEILREVIEDTLTEAPDLMRQLEQAFAEDRVADAGRLAHTLKATARTFGVSEMTQHADEIEQTAAGGRLDSVAGKVPELRRLLDRVLEELETRLTQTS